MIKSNLFKPKNIRRMTVFLALLAPLVYLFGSQFAALAGAHGEEVLADGNALVAPDYEELMTPDNFSYGAFDWENDEYYRYGFSLGVLDIGYYNGDSNIIRLHRLGVSTSVSGRATFINGGLGFAFPDPSEEVRDSFRISVNSSSSGGAHIQFNFGYDVEQNGYFGFYTVSGDSVTAFVCHYDAINEYENFYSYSYDLSSGDWLETYVFSQYNFYTSGHLLLYFDDGQNLPEGVEWNDELRSYFVPTVKATQQASYSSTLFGSMFGHDNFLVDIGRNALSDDPKGFAPFGSFWSYLDSNVLHLADSDIGLMGYGYMYYAAHVLLFDIGFMLLTFFLAFIQKIGDRFAGGD